MKRSQNIRLSCLYTAERYFNQRVLTFCFFYYHRELFNIKFCLIFCYGHFGVIINFRDPEQTGWRNLVSAYILRSNIWYFNRLGSL